MRVILQGIILFSSVSLYMFVLPAEEINGETTISFMLNDFEFTLFLHCTSHLTLIMPAAQKRPVTSWPP